MLYLQKKKNKDEKSSDGSANWHLDHWSNSSTGELTLHVALELDSTRSVRWPKNFVATNNRSNDIAQHGRIFLSQ
jgi:hypothetical protein